MINGFVIEIKNTSNQKQCVRLFSDEVLAYGVLITTRHSDYDYNTLRTFAIKDGFIGSGINADEVFEFVIHNGILAEVFQTKFLPDKEIELDGDLKFIEVNIPADTGVLFQLMPIFK